MQIQIAKYLQKIENSMQCEDLKQFFSIEKFRQQESFGLSMMQFYEALSAKKRLDNLLSRKQKKVSIFDHMQGISSFIKSTPQSLHFYPSAKKIYQQENFFEKSEKNIRMKVKALKIPFYIDFYDILDTKTSQKKAEAHIKQFIEEIFRILRRYERLSLRVLYQ